MEYQYSVTSTATCIVFFRALASENSLIVSEKPKLRSSLSAPAFLAFAAPLETATLAIRNYELRSPETLYTTMRR